MRYIEIAITPGPTLKRTVRFAKESSAYEYDHTNKVWTLPATAGLFNPGVNRTQYQYTILRRWEL
jgi:hypothetical protein